MPTEPALNRIALVERRAQPSSQDGPRVRRYSLARISSSRNPEAERLARLERLERVAEVSPISTGRPPAAGPDPAR